MQFFEHSAGFHLEHLGADTADVVVGGGQRAVVHETPQVATSRPLL